MSHWGGELEADPNADTREAGGGEAKSWNWQKKQKKQTKKKPTTWKNKKWVKDQKQSSNKTAHTEKAKTKTNENIRNLNPNIPVGERK